MSLIEKVLSIIGRSGRVSLPTLKNISTLMTGTVVSAIIPILAAPAMSRIFTTSDYGILGIYMSISGLIGVLGYVHYPQAIMLTKHNDEARQIMWFSIFFCSIVAVLSLVIIICLLSFTPLLIHSPLRFWLLIIPLSVLMNGISSSILVWANRNQQYKILSSNRIIQAVFTVIVQITLGLLIKDETGLMLGLIGGQLISVTLLCFRFQGNITTSIGKPQYNAFKAIAIKYKKLLFYTTPSEFINNLINQTPIFLLQKFAGISYVGSYNFTLRLLGLPQQFLSSAIVELFKQKASFAYNNEGNCRRVFVKTFKGLSLLAMVPFLLIVAFSPKVFAFIFGAEWQLAGEFAQFLGILFFFRFIASPLSYVYIIAGRFKEDFLLHILFLIVTTLSFYIGNLYFEDKKYLLLAYALAYSSIYVIYLFRSYKFSRP